MPEERMITNWEPVSSLRCVAENISDFGYSRQYAESNLLMDKKESYWSNYVGEERVCLFEDLEVKEENGTVYWRENDNCFHKDMPEFFDSQFGRFRNHNNGEFMSWIEREDPEGSSVDDSCFPGESSICGNFCDLFDCGSYVIAVSNLMHMGLGSFSIVRISADLNPVTLFDNLEIKHSCLEYVGRYRDADGYVIIASGYLYGDRESLESSADSLQDKTFLFRIGVDGSCTVIKEWDVLIPSSNSMVVVGDFAWFGHNKIVSCLNLSSGEFKYYTNKSDEDLADLRNMEYEDESKYIAMSEKSYLRPAQIPIRTERFRYLTKQYRPGMCGSDWVMFHHPGHFVIYERKSKHCVFDASYIMLGDPESETEDLVAVISEIRISQDEAVPRMENDFGVLMHLITEIL